MAPISGSWETKFSQSCTNLKSAFETPSTTSALSSDIAAQIANGWTHGPLNKPPFHNFCHSPLGAVTHKQSTKVHCIHHPSWLDGGSVNNGIPNLEATITDIITSRLGSLMIKLSLELTFHHIPVWPEDWHLLGFTWEGKFLYDLVLGFECCLAPYIFNLFAEAIHWIIQQNLPACVWHYLDDFLKIFAPHLPLSKVKAALTWSLDIGAQLGLASQPSKVKGPSITLEFLGLKLDSIAMEVHLPCKKLDYLSKLLTSWAHCSHCTLQELQELTGFLQFASQVVPTSHAYIWGLYAFTSKFTTNFLCRHISKASWWDITWWLRFSANWNEIQFLSPKQDTIHIYTDASGAKGLGGHFGVHWFSACCPCHLCHEHIQVKEMFAVIHAILCWGDDLCAKHVIFHVDNDAVFKGINDLSIRSVPTMKLIQQLIYLACCLGFTFSFVWLSSADKMIADAASCFAYS
jgi:hypothetical protein